MYYWFLNIIFYRSSEKHIQNKNILIDNLIQIKKKEKQISLASNNKTYIQ